jgi:hypothetical protein
MLVTYVESLGITIGKLFGDAYYILEQYCGFFKESLIKRFTGRSKRRVACKNLAAIRIKENWVALMSRRRQCCM